MYTVVESATVERMTLPEPGADLNYAAGDPLTSTTMLWRIFREHDRGDDSTALDYIRLSSLVSNPVLPPDMFAALLVKLKRGEEKNCSAQKTPMSYDFLSSFFLNPLTTFDHVLDIVVNSANLKEIVGLGELRTVKTTVELFDDLRSLIDFNSRGFPSGYRTFLTNLLCSPLISDEDFRARIWFEEDMPKLSAWAIVVNSRFIPSAADYERALKELSVGSFKTGLGIVINENASPEFLVDALKCAGDSWVHQNLNCPIELSASYHFKNLESYEWRPSYALKLEQKTDEYLSSISNDVSWADLPLSWKLKTIAG